MSKLFSTVNISTIKTIEGLEQALEGKEVIDNSSPDTDYYNIEKAVILENATENGYPAIYLVINLGDNKVIVATMTGRLFCGVAQAIKGVAERTNKTDL